MIYTIFNRSKVIAVTKELMALQSGENIEILTEANPIGTAGSFRYFDIQFFHQQF